MCAVICTHMPSHVNAALQAASTVSVSVHASGHPDEPAFASQNNDQCASTQGARHACGAGRGAGRHWDRPHRCRAVLDGTAGLCRSHPGVRPPAPATAFAPHPQIILLSPHPTPPPHPPRGARAPGTHFPPHVRICINKLSLMSNSLIRLADSCLLSI